MEDYNNHQPKLHTIYLKLLPVFLVVLISLLHHETVQSLFVRWIKWDESLSHGLIIVGLFFFFLFSISPLIAQPKSKGLQIFFLGSLGASSIIWYLSNLINLQIIEQLSLLSLIVFTFVCVFGTHILRQQIVLLLLPIFAIPIWDQLVNPLVNLSGFMVGKMVQQINIAAVIDNNSIFIPYGEIIIADGCSGLRYLTISLAIAYIISYLNGYSVKKTLVALCIATIIGLLSNWIRIFILVIVGYESQMQSSLMSDHEYFGWGLFALIVFPAIYFAPVVKRAPPVSRQKHSAPSTQAAIAPLLVLCIGPALSHFLHIAPSPSTIPDKIPHEYAPILSKKMPISVEAGNPTKSENAIDGNRVFVQISHYQRKDSNAKLVPYIARLYDNISWSIINEQINKTDAFSFRIQIFRNKHNGIIVAQTQWFDVAGMTTNNYSIAKLLQIPAIIGGHNTFSMYTLQSICTSSSCALETDNIMNLGKILTNSN